MSDTTEALAAVLAEMRAARNAASDTTLVWSNWLTQWADRIEAAYKRELSRAAEDAASKATLDRTVKDAAEYMAYAMAHNSAPQPGNAAPRKFDEAAFDAAVSKPNGWSDVADPVAEIRRMRDGDAPGNAAALRDALEEQLRYWNSHVRTRDEEEMRKRTEAALAAPARNVDRFQTADEAVAAFADHLRAWENAHGIHSEYPDHPVKVPAGAFAWLFAPAEGGAE